MIKRGNPRPSPMARSADPGYMLLAEEQDLVVAVDGVAEAAIIELAEAVSSP